jgi:ribonuclease-3
MDKEELKALEATLEHTFSNPALLERALTHSSHAHEESRADARSAGESSGVERIDNEQLEFLGDAVLGLVCSQLLFERFASFH